MGGARAAPASEAQLIGAHSSRWRRDGPLQWTQMYQMELNDACAALLPAVVPRLQRVEVKAQQDALSSSAFLAQLPELTCIDVNSAAGQRADVDRLLLTLSAALPRVTELSLSGTDMRSAGLRAVFARFPALQKLSLTHAACFKRLALLSPVRHSLHTLSLVDSGHCNDDEEEDEKVKGERIAARVLKQLPQLPQLTSLTLLESLRLDKKSRRALEPPSTLLPKLTYFHCDDEDEEDEDDEDEGDEDEDREDENDEDQEL